MDEIIRAVMRLLLFINTGVNGEYDFLLLRPGLDASLPCRVSICYVTWYHSIATESYTIARVRGGRIPKSDRLRVDSDCSLQIQNITKEDTGLYFCERKAESQFTYLSLLNVTSSRQGSNLMPGEMLSVQCALLAEGGRSNCLDSPYDLVSLSWVDEAGVEIQDDDRHQIQRRSSCRVTLLITLQEADTDRKLRCQGTFSGEVKTSVDFPIRVVDGRGTGRKGIIESIPDGEGDNNEVIGLTLGVAACAVLTVTVALILLHRRADTQLTIDPGNMAIDNNNINGGFPNDVIYANINHHASRGTVQEHQGDSTEYASIKTT